MKLEQSAVLCRIITGEEEKIDGRPFVEKIIEMAKVHDISGVTVFKGVMGFGCHRHIHTAKVLHLSENLPILIEIIECEEKIKQFIKLIAPLMHEGMITTESVQVTFIRLR